MDLTANSTGRKVMGHERGSPIMIPIVTTTTTKRSGKKKTTPKLKILGAAPSTGGKRGHGLARAPNGSRGVSLKEFQGSEVDLG